MTIFNFPSQPAFNTYAYAENVGGIINGSDIKINGVGLVNEGFSGNYVSLGGLNPNGLKIIAIYDMKNKINGGPDGIIRSGGVGIGGDVNGFPFVINALGSWFSPLRFQSGPCVFIGSGSFGYPYGPISLADDILYQDVTVTITCSPTKINGYCDVTIRYENPQAGLDHTEVFIDGTNFASPGSLCRLIITGPSIDSGTGYLDLTSLEIIEGPISLPIVYNSYPLGMNFFEPAAPLVGEWGNS